MKLSVLLYPNITFAKNLEADSYIVVASQLIRALNKVRDDLAFTALVPEPVAALAFPNVEQRPYPLPTYPNTMRAHFDTRDFLYAIDWKRRSFDVVWSHLPEHTLAIKNVFYNTTNERPVFVGYSHWAEIPANTTYPETLFSTNVAGMLALDECGVNSEWCKRVLLAEAEKILSAAALADLDRIVRPQYLGCDVPDVAVMPEPKLLVWNHRLSPYTGYTDALRALDRLWERRQDFRVMFTLGDVDKPYAAPVRIDKADYRTSYLTTLGRAWAGLGRAGYAPWAVAVMDGFNLGIPYVLPVDACYPEIVGNDYPLLYDDEHELEARIEQILDDPALRDRLSAEVKSRASEFSWDARAGEFSEMFDRAATRLPTLTRPTPKYVEVVKLAKAGASKEQITKRMGWGRGIPWSSYRNMLRSDGIEIG